MLDWFYWIHLNLLIKGIQYKIRKKNTNDFGVIDYSPQHSIVGDKASVDHFQFGLVYETQLF